MTATDWTLFAVVTLLTLGALLALARATRRALSSPTARPAGDPAEPLGAGDPGPADAFRNPFADGIGLLANVAVSQGLLVGVLLGAAWYARVPPAAFGAGDWSLTAVGVGIALGIVLVATNEGAMRLADLSGVGYDERLRELLTPATPAGWLLLLLVVLPIVAVSEELLFRGALIGAPAAGFGVSPWLLAVASSLVFGLGHGVQGPLGVVVTGTLGFALAGAFVVTDSLVVVVVAHYLVNALEFLGHELRG